jgi:hypothetical protein
MVDRTNLVPRHEGRNILPCTVRHFIGPTTFHRTRDTDKVSSLSLADCSDLQVVDRQKPQCEISEEDGRGIT